MPLELNIITCTKLELKTKLKKEPNKAFLVLVDMEDSIAKQWYLCFPGKGTESAVSYIEGYVDELSAETPIARLMSSLKTVEEAEAHKSELEKELEKPSALVKHKHRKHHHKQKQSSPAPTSISASTPASVLAPIPTSAPPAASTLTPIPILASAPSPVSVVSLDAVASKEQEELKTFEKFVADVYAGTVDDSIFDSTIKNIAENHKEWLKQEIQFTSKIKGNVFHAELLSKISNIRIENLIEIMQKLGPEYDPVNMPVGVYEEKQFPLRAILDKEDLEKAQILVKHGANCNCSSTVDGEISLFAYFVNKDPLKHDSISFLLGKNVDLRNANSPKSLQREIVAYCAERNLPIFSFYKKDISQLNERELALLQETADLVIISPVLTLFLKNEFELVEFCLAKDPKLANLRFPSIGDVPEKFYGKTILEVCHITKNESLIRFIDDLPKPEITKPDAKSLQSLSSMQKPKLEPEKLETLKELVSILIHGTILSKTFTELWNKIKNVTGIHSIEIPFNESSVTLLYAVLMSKFDDSTTFKLFQEIVATMDATDLRDFAIKPVNAVYPLSVALANGHIAVAQELVNLGANVNSGFMYSNDTQRHKSLLAYYCEKKPLGEKDIFAIKFLLKNEARLDQTIQSLAEIRVIAMQDFREKNTQVPSFFSEAQSRINEDPVALECLHICQTHYGTPIILALFDNESLPVKDLMSLIDSFLEREPNLRNKVFPPMYARESHRGCTILKIAAKCGNIDMAEMLLSNCPEHDATEEDVTIIRDCFSFLRNIPVPTSGHIDIALKLLLFMKNIGVTLEEPKSCINSIEEMMTIVNFFFSKIDIVVAKISRPIEQINSILNTKGIKDINATIRYLVMNAPSSEESEVLAAIRSKTCKAPLGEITSILRGGEDSLLENLKNALEKINADDLVAIFVSAFRNKFKDSLGKSLILDSLQSVVGEKFNIFATTYDLQVAIAPRLRIVDIWASDYSDYIHEEKKLQKAGEDELMRYQRDVSSKDVKTTQDTVSNSTSSASPQPVTTFPELPARPITDLLSSKLNPAPAVSLQSATTPPELPARPECTATSTNIPPPPPSLMNVSVPASRAPAALLANIRGYNKDKLKKAATTLPAASFNGSMADALARKIQQVKDRSTRATVVFEDNDEFTDPRLSIYILPTTSQQAAAPMASATAAPAPMASVTVAPAPEVSANAAPASGVPTQDLKKMLGKRRAGIRDSIGYGTIKGTPDASAAPAPVQGRGAGKNLLLQRKGVLNPANPVGGRGEDTSKTPSGPPT